MRSIAILALFIAPFLANAMNVTNVLDRTKGFSAVVITLPAEENHGFSFLDVPTKIEGDTIRSYWNPTNHLIIFNGGYFNPDFTPVGLCRADGLTINSNQSQRLSGFVGIDKTGKLHVLTRQDKLESYPTVLQAGPFVIDPGGKIGIHSRSGVEARRTLVGITEADDLVIIVTEPIYLLDLANFIAKRFPSIDRLLNLDGGPSTALISDGHEILNQWPVRNYLIKTRETPTTVSTVRGKPRP